MSIRFTLIFTLVAALMGAGCAAQRGNRAVANQDARSSPARATTNEVVVGPATQPIDAKANLTLDQIQPAPQLPTSRPALSDDRSPPPLEALELYARARDALASGHQFTAISALERAIKLDPDSAELYRLVSRAYLAGGNTNKAVDALHARFSSSLMICDRRRRWRDCTFSAATPPMRSTTCGLVCRASNTPTMRPPPGSRITSWPNHCNSRVTIARRWSNTRNCWADCRSGRTPCDTRCGIVRLVRAASGDLLRCSAALRETS